MLFDPNLQLLTCLEIIFRRFRNYIEKGHPETRPPPRKSAT
jgi:hypothetical protein